MERKANNMEKLLEIIIGWLYDVIKGVLIIAATLNLIACKSESASPATPVESPQPVTIDVKVYSGLDYDCFAYGPSLYCRGITQVVGSVSSMELNTTTFIEYLTASADIADSDLAFRDQSFCLKALVAERPMSNDLGYAIYCFGQGGWIGSYSAYPFVYGASSFDFGGFGSVDLTYHAEPFAASEGLDLVEVGSWSGDTTDSVSDTTVSCTIDGGVATCPGFSLTL